MLVTKPAGAPESKSQASEAEPFIPADRLQRQLNLIVSRLETRFIQAHVLFTGIHLLKHLSARFLPCAGLRLGVLRQFQAFLASSPCAPSAGSSGFRSPWPVRSLSFLRFGSNLALKPTRILRAAYLVR